jgi:hypothetical protein
VTVRWFVDSLCALILFAVGCNSDLPVSATTEVAPLGIQVTVTRVATHPFLARYNLRLTVNAPAGCSASSELFPDTGGVSRRNLYLSGSGQLYVVGQFDARVFDEKRCLVELVEFRSLETNMVFLGAFDVGQENQWTFIPEAIRHERTFEKL